MSQHLGAPSVFEFFNARNFSPRQVAERFIPPPRHFDELILRRHSLVIGPRGSGKTTLLKMLQLPALAAWPHPEATRYRTSIDFTGVFVAADVSWGAQLSALGRGTLPAFATELLGLSAFTSHVLIALIDAMRDCAGHPPHDAPGLQNKYVQLSKEQELEACRLIAASWKIEPALFTFFGLKLALRQRLSEIAQIARREALTKDSDIDQRLNAYGFLHLNFLESAIFAIEVFNEVAKQQDRRWAFLFDELEIAPKQIRRALFAAFRSTDQRLIFKLSISPYHEDAEVLQGSTSPMAGQDYQPIELWYPRKEEGYSFSEALLHAMLEEAGAPAATPEQVFGDSFFDAGETERERNLSAYRPGTSLHRRFKSLANKDESFREYLLEHRIDLSRMHLLNENERAGLVRKGASVIAVREAFRTPSQLAGAPTRIERSRKTPTLYTGSRSLFAIIEGNPRWFIGIMGSMVRMFKAEQRPVPRSVQARTITTATNRFRALLRTIPYSPANSSSSRSLLSLLDVIGNTFHNNVVSGAFNPDPPLSFTVDSTTSSELLLALGRALNAGAIILAPDQGGDTLLSSIRGKRFRLSYMLAPGYGIPLTLGRRMALSQILEASGRAEPQLSLLER